VSPFLRARISGSIQVLSADSKAVLDAPDQLATMSFVVPPSDNGKWIADGSLYDAKNRPVGSMHFACLWSAQGEYREHLTALRLAQSNQAEQQVAEQSAIRMTWFWFILGLFLFILTGALSYRCHSVGPSPGTVRSGVKMS
jgi:hypothetical protein